MQKNTLKGAILTGEQMQKVIERSHKRSKAYGIDREERKTDHDKLTLEELEERRTANKETLELVKATIEEFYDLMSPDDFLVGFADSHGYILHLAGGDVPKGGSEDRNFSSGYRGTERDVGTMCCRSIYLTGIYSN
jgi:transcriptional regulator of acetoin/glycerol metabolism